MSIYYSRYSFVMFGDFVPYSKQEVKRYTKNRRKNQLAKISRRKNRYSK